MKWCKVKEQNKVDEWGRIIVKECGNTKVFVEQNNQNLYAPYYMAYAVDFETHKRTPIVARAKLETAMQRATQYNG